jgi:hypothetical protein
MNETFCQSDSCGTRPLHGETVLICLHELVGGNALFRILNPELVEACCCGYLLYQEMTRIGQYPGVLTSEKLKEVCSLGNRLF